MVLGAAVVAGFMVRVYYSYGAARDSDAYQNFVTQLNLLASQAIATSEGAPDYSRVSNFSVSGYLPNSMVLVPGNPATLVSAYRKPINVHPVDVTLGGKTSPSGGLEIDAAMPSNDCYKLAMADPQTFKVMGVNMDPTDFDGATPQPFPFTSADAQKLCGNLTNLNAFVAVKLVMMDDGSVLGAAE